MRKVKIPSTKAAHERLATLQYPLALAIPFDEERIAPFGIRIKTLGNGYHRVVLTFEGQDFGIVDRFDGDSICVDLAIDASPPIEQAVQKVFKIINTHTSRVAKVLSEEAKILKTYDADTPEYQHAQQAQNSRRGAFQDAEDEKAERQRWSTELRSCNGWGVPRDEGQDVILTGITRDDLENAQRFTGYKDGMEIRTVGRRVYDDMPQPATQITLAGGKSWFFSNTDVGLVLQEEHRFVPDPAKIVPHILAIAARNRRLLDDEYKIEPLSHLPPARYAIERFSMSDLQAKPEGSQRHVLSDAAEIKMNHESVWLRVENVTVAEWKIWNNQAHISGAVRVIGDRELFGTPDILSRVGDMWMREYLAPQGVDLEAFRPFNVDEIEDDAVRADFGYTF